MHQIKLERKFPRSHKRIFCYFEFFIQIIQMKDWMSALARERAVRCCDCARAMPLSLQMIVLMLLSLRHRWLSLTHLTNTNILHLNYYSTWIIKNKLFQLPLLLLFCLDYCKISMPLQLGVNETNRRDIFSYCYCVYVYANVCLRLWVEMIVSTQRKKKNDTNDLMDECIFSNVWWLFKIFRIIK